MRFAEGRRTARGKVVVEEWTMSALVRDATIGWCRAHVSWSSVSDVLYTRRHWSLYTLVAIHLLPIGIACHLASHLGT